MRMDTNVGAKIRNRKGFPTRPLNFFLAQSRFHAIHECRRVILEEIEVHGDGNLENQVAFERCLVENLVDVVTGAANLTRQPTDAALVGFQLFSDEMPNMEVASCVDHHSQLWRQK